MTKQRWSSRFNFIMVTAGAAVGLGPIWKFPYMAGENGGGAFVLVLIFAMFIVGVPILIAEMSLGRLGRANPIASMQKLAKKNGRTKKWGLLGWWGALALMLVLSFYSVIAGWSLAYLYKLLTGNLHNLNAEQILTVWQNFMHAPIELIFWHSCFMLLTIYVVARGINKGLEGASRIMMPGLFIVLIVLTVYSSIVGDFTGAANFLFKPDFSKLSPSIILNALGQAAFALAIGAGCMLTYGCYVPDNTRIGKDSLIIASMLLLSSILSGLAMFPLVFAYKLPVTSGPGLMFTVLPIAFNNMPFGTFFGALFFIMLWFAAWTSSISMAEPLVLILQEQAKIKRIPGSIIIGVIAWIIGVFAILSFDFIFPLIADFATNIILPTGALGFAIFAGWLLKKQDIYSAVKFANIKNFKIWSFLIRYLAPIIIVSVFAMELFA